MKINNLIQLFVIVSILFLSSCFNDSKIIVYSLADTEDPLNNKVLKINNIKSEKIKNITVYVWADNADKIIYKVDKSALQIDDDNYIGIPLKYLVADKKSKIKVDIELNNNTRINKNFEMQINLTDDKNIYMSDNIPEFISVKRPENNKQNKLYYLDFYAADRINLETAKEMKIEKKYIHDNFAYVQYPFPLYVDTYGNIRKIKTKLTDDNFDISDYRLERNTAYSDKRKTFFSLATNYKKSTVSDVIIEINKDKNKILNVIDLDKILDCNRNFVTDDNLKDEDWLHPNSIIYVENEDALIISSRYHGVFKMTLDGKLVWILSPHKNWKNPLKEKLLKAADLSGNILAEIFQDGKKIYKNNGYEFEWPYGQHSINLLNNNDLLLFDNGLNRNKYCEDAAQKYSRAVVYRIDEKNKTVSQIWQYGKEEGEKLFSLAHGNVVVSEPDVYFINFDLIIDKSNDTSSAVIKEIKTDDKSTLFELDINFKNKHKYEGSKYDEIFDAFPLYV